MGLKLNLGCWRRDIPGFVNVDLCDMPHIHHKTSIDSLPMIEDGSCELVYASHSLEYFDRQEAAGVLKEWRRVLEPGGALRVAVPDFDALIEVYKRSGELGLVLGPLYGRMEIETPDGTRVLYHKSVYNFAHLKTLLEECGFTNVRRYDWRETVHRDHDDHSQAYWPHMDKEKGLLVSLNVEADKA
jgi:predicted SAM-dependent methyltransferase